MVATNREKLPVISPNSDSMLSSTEFFNKIYPLQSLPGRISTGRFGRGAALNSIPASVRTETYTSRWLIAGANGGVGSTTDHCTAQKERLVTGRRKANKLL